MEKKLECQASTMSHWVVPVTTERGRAWREERILGQPPEGAHRAEFCKETPHQRLPRGLSMSKRGCHQGTQVARQGDRTGRERGSRERALWKATASS